MLPSGVIRDQQYSMPLFRQGTHFVISLPVCDTGESRDGKR